MEETLHRRILSFILSIIMCLSLCLGNVLYIGAADTSGTYGAFTVTGSDLTGCSYDSSLLTISKGGTYTISGTSTSDRIEITAADADVIITFDNLDIQTGSVPFNIAASAESDVTIKLSGTNVLKATGWYAGALQKLSTENTLTITSASGDGSTDGSLTATGNASSAGIGTNNSYECKNIIINGGTITAAGGLEGAGIGGAAAPKRQAILR